MFVLLFFFFFSPKRTRKNLYEKKQKEKEKQKNADSTRTQNQRVNLVTLKSRNFIGGKEEKKDENGTGRNVTQMVVRSFKKKKMKDTPGYPGPNTQSGTGTPSDLEIKQTLKK